MQVGPANHINHEKQRFFFFVAEHGAGQQKGESEGCKVQEGRKFLCYFCSDIVGHVCRDPKGWKS